MRKYSLGITATGFIADVVPSDDALETLDKDIITESILEAANKRLVKIRGRLEAEGVHVEFYILPE